LGCSLQRRSENSSIANLSGPELVLSARDPILFQVISSLSERWPAEPTEDPIWGLLRIVMAQQISTIVACRLAERVRTAFPDILAGAPHATPSVRDLRAFGLPERRAMCCIELLNRSQEILANVKRGQSWEVALRGIKGIGPWTISTFRVMVLRDPDVLPLGDVGLERAISNAYGVSGNVEELGEKWRPFRSVACWYLWRTLGNEQLG
jgi:DNA-3-methyladenine glycosylase II